MKFLILSFAIISTQVFAGPYSKTAAEIKAVLDSPTFKKEFGDQPINEVWRSGNTYTFTGLDEFCGTSADVKWMLKPRTRIRVPKVIDVSTACE